jgi:hypothetical protein
MLFFSIFDVALLEVASRFSEALSAGDEAGSVLRAPDGADGEDFWKKPRIDRWFFMFCVLEVDRFSAPEGGVAVVGEDAVPAPLAILTETQWSAGTM